MKLSAGIGGYSPFSFTTQSDSDGGKSILRVKPTFFLSGLFEVPFSHFLSPEFGWVLHGEGEDSYSKNTYYLLTDLIYPITADLVLRYGYGLFMTRISGDGEAIQLNNGTATATFYTAGEASTSYNSTLNLGFEYVVRADATFRVQSFIFQPFSSTDREVSYMLSYAFFFDGGGSL
jgi:hypothetical protein